MGLFNPISLAIAATASLLARGPATVCAGLPGTRYRSAKVTNIIQTILELCQLFFLV